MAQKNAANLSCIAVTVTAFTAIAACGRTTQEVPPVNDSIKQALEDFSNRRVYRTLDVRILMSIPDDQLEQAVFDYATSKVEGHYDDEANIVNGLPPGVRALYLTWIVEAEVNNGGFNQYYWNTEDRFSGQAVQAFEFFGASKHAALMRKANSARSNEMAALAKFKNKGTLEAFSESYEESRLGPLDEGFYKLDENLSSLRIGKMRAMPAQFAGN